MFFALILRLVVGITNYERGYNPGSTIITVWEGFYDTLLIKEKRKEIDEVKRIFDLDRRFIITVSLRLAQSCLFASYSVSRWKTTELQINY
jgi:hypothetical protein